jgi:uncharacterized protein (DUF697 family)
MADGSQTELERDEIKRLASRFSEDGLDLTEAYQDTLAGRVSMPKLASQIQSTEGKLLAYEMAVCICNVDNALSNSEQQFLSNLHRALELDVTSTRPVQETAASFSASTLGAATLAQPPVLSNYTSNSKPTTQPPAQTSEVDEIIMNRAILAGALEVMPQNLSTMAIIPVQMQLVYQIGKRHGFDLDLSHAKEFLATVGVGMTSQMVESYLTRLVHGATKKFAGKFVGGLASQATESAIAFATTYAIGQAAKAYYAGGRTLSMEQLREVFSRMLSQGRQLRTQYAGEIAQRSSQLNFSDLVSLGKRG